MKDLFTIMEVKLGMSIDNVFTFNGLHMKLPHMTGKNKIYLLSVIFHRSEVCIQLGYILCSESQGIDWDAFSSGVLTRQESTSKLIHLSECNRVVRPDS